MNTRNYTITGHMVVKNEDRWIWYAIMSVIDFVDIMYIYDTGSIDHTKEIINELVNRFAGKIIYEEFENVTPENFYKIRQKQLDATNTDYFMVVDGDEIWYQSALEELNKILELNRPQLVATRFVNCCGDVYHYRYNHRESYCINGIKGAISVRVFSTSIPGIKCSGIYGIEGYVDKDEKPVQNNVYETKVMKGYFLHTSLLNRSSAANGDFSIRYRRAKLYADWDEKFDKSFCYPEVFYSKNNPRYVKSAFEKDINLLRMTIKSIIRIKSFIYCIYDKTRQIIK